MRKVYDSELAQIETPRTVDHTDGEGAACRIIQAQ